MTTPSTHTQSDIPGIVRALTYRAEDVAAALLGEPSQVSRHEQRWGRNGSLSLRRTGAKRGFWYDHERGEGGDLLHLVARERNVRLSEAITIAEHEFVGGSPPASAQIEPKPRTTEPDEDCEARVRAAGRIWADLKPPAGTLAERYFVEHRGLDVRRLDLAHALRWHADIRAVVALMTDPITSRPTGIHRTFLDPDGDKFERKMLGRQGVVRLSPNSEVTMGLGIAEGIEDSLAVLLSGWAPVWAATSAGAIARFPVLDGIEALTIFADADASGMQAAGACAARWRAAGREVRQSYPREAAHVQ